ncbi:Zn-ribbon domain-containing OB-fold protein [Candidatus Woesearchaeota archaeon]|nr:Zn-ribbon domain-containing OB-fold protein [Candidatus Woesearchaeota archaeon]
MTVPRIWRKIPQYYNLIGKKCQKCNSLYFPPRDVCTHCGEINLQNYKLEGNGEIITFTVIRTPMPDPEGEIIDIPGRQIPYIIAIIKLDQGPCLTSEIVDCSPGEVKIGKKVKSVFRKIVEKGPRGVIQYGCKFKLI